MPDYLLTRGINRNGFPAENEKSGPGSVLGWRYYRQYKSSDAVVGRRPATQN